MKGLNISSRRSAGMAGPSLTNETSTKPSFSETLMSMKVSAYFTALWIRLLSIFRRLASSTLITILSSECSKDILRFLLLAVSLKL